MSTYSWLAYWVDSTDPSDGASQTPVFCAQRLYLRPLHNRENLAVVTEKNIQLRVIARHFGRK